MAPTPTKISAKVPMNSATHCLASDGFMHWGAAAVFYLFVLVLSLTGADPPLEAGRLVTMIAGRFMLVALGRLVRGRMVRLVFRNVGGGVIRGALVFFSSGCAASRSSMRKPASEAMPLNWLPFTSSSYRSSACAGLFCSS